MLHHYVYLELLQYARVPGPMLHILLLFKENSKNGANLGQCRAMWSNIGAMWGNVEQYRGNMGAIWTRGKM